jgi:hypothetical protein
MAPMARINDLVDRSGMDERGTNVTAAIIRVARSTSGATVSNENRGRAVNRPMVEEAVIIEGGIINKSRYIIIREVYSIFRRVKKKFSPYL